MNAFIKITSKYFLIVSLLCFSEVQAQDDLEKLLEETEGKPKKEYVSATFKGTKIINGQSVANTAKGVLQFQIAHRFGPVNSGSYEFYGLDGPATIRLGFEYGITSRLAAGIGRSSLNKTYDSYLKYQLIKQSTGVGSMPFSVVLYTNAAASTVQKSTSDAPVNFANRLAYSSQILIARKFSEKLSLQVMPTYIHRNLVPTPTDQNDVFAIGAGGRMKLSKRFALTGEYHYLLPGTTADQFNNSFALGFDMETGGHVFQIHVTNSQGMIESQFIPGTQGKWSKGDIRIGFNISRVFTIVKPKAPKTN